MATVDAPLRVELATPCRADWREMSGDARRRFCAQCQKHVYDLSGLTRAEVRALLERPEGAPCVRFFQRPDGTVLTADCPAGLREHARRLAWRARAAWTAGVLGVLAVLGLGTVDDREPAFEPVPIPRVVQAPPAPVAPQLPLPLLPSAPRTGGHRYRSYMGLPHRMGAIQIIKGMAK